MIEQLPGLALLLGLGFVIAWVFVVGYTAWMLTHPVRRTYAAAVAKGRPGDPGEADSSLSWAAFVVRSRGIDLSAWSIDGRDAGGPVLVMTHGWSDGKVGGLVRLGAVLGSCSRVVLWDMPGQGESGGRCDLGASEAADLRAVVDACSGGRPVVLLGWSMGAGVSLVAACGEGRVIGVVAEAPYRSAFTPARNVLASRGLPWRLTLWPALALVGLLRGRWARWMLRGSSFDRVGVAERVACPVLVLHGDKDVISPSEDGRAIAKAAAQGSYTEIAGATHNGMWTVDGTGEAAAGAVAGFLASLGGGSRDAAAHTIRHEDGGCAPEPDG